MSYVSSSLQSFICKYCSRMFFNFFNGGFDEVYFLMQFEVVYLVAEY